ncbi:MAG: hypothetical protein AAF597_19925 [Bacteroidota bacterium]
MLKLPTTLLEAARAEVLGMGKEGIVPLASLADKKRNGKYLGYLSALGPALRRLGLLAALVNYRDEGSSDELTRPVYDCLQRLLSNQAAGLLIAGERAKLEGSGDLVDFLLTLAPQQRLHLRPRLETALLALKLAMRTFPLPSTPEFPTDE